MRHYQRITGGSAGGAPPAAGSAPGGGSCPVPDLGSQLSEAVAEGPTTLGSVNALSNYHHRSYRDLVPQSSGDPFAGILGDGPTS
jgi:hypothetical protein